MRVGVFCGSQFGSIPGLKEEACKVGKLLASQGHELVYGGGSVGLMKQIADGVLDAGGNVIGVIPTALREKELAHESVQEMIEVKTMAERKDIMMEKSDIFICLPGGYGTLDEMMEVITMNKLAYFRKPIGLWNFQGFYSSLDRFFLELKEKNFIHENLDGNDLPDYLINSVFSELLEDLIKIV